MYEDLRNQYPYPEALLVGPPEFTARELDIMSVLWREGSGTVAEVQGALPDRPGYTTVLKLLQILEEKRAVRHEEQGRAYRYFPVVAPEEAGGRALQRILEKIYLGSAELVLARLVGDRRLSAEELRRMRRLLERAERERREEGDAVAEAGGAEEEP